MSEETQRWRVGDARITSIVEAQTDGIPPSFMFPAADETLVLRDPALVPYYADTRGSIHMRVQALVVEAAGRTVVVDPCVGNGKVREQPWWNRQSSSFMERFLAAGFDPAEVDLVVHTHVHVDHVGWDTHLDGDRWVPTFTGARHVYTKDELDWSATSADPHERQIHADSIAPVLDADLAEVVAPDADLGGGIRLQPTPGHTPGHVALWVESRGERALLAGDVVHHPLQCATPDLAFLSDVDPDEARATRRRLLATAAEADALLLPAHAPTVPALRVAAQGSAWRCRPVEPNG